MDKVEITFDGPVWLWSANTAVHFVSLPQDDSDQIEAVHGGRAVGFGAIKVAVQIGLSQWRTSLFPSAEHKTYVLPLKKAIRAAQNIEVGDVITVHLTVL